MSRLVDFFKNLQLRSYPHFYKMPQSASWITQDAKLKSQRSFAQRRRDYFHRASLVVAGFFIVSAIGTARGLSQYLSPTSVPSIIAINITFACGVLMWPLAFLMFYLSEAATQHDKWLRDNPSPERN